MGKYTAMAMGSKTKRAINFSKGNEKKEKKNWNERKKEKKFFLHNKKAPEVEEKVFHSVELRKKNNFLSFFSEEKKEIRKSGRCRYIFCCYETLSFQQNIHVYIQYKIDKRGGSLCFFFSVFFL